MGKKDSFAVNSLVFAKVKGYPAWPAKVFIPVRNRVFPPLTPLCCLAGHKTAREKQVLRVLLRNRRDVSVPLNAPEFQFKEPPPLHSANIKIEDLFPYAENKAKFVNDKNLKRANFSEAIDQIEAALSGDDPSPISTQTENGTAAAPEDAAAPVEGSETAVAAKTEIAKTTAKSQPATEKVVEPANKAPPKSKKANNAQPTANGKGKAQAKKAEETPDPPASEEPLKVDSISTATEDILTKMEPKAVIAAAEVADTESPTSRSGRKIKPKK